MKTTDTKFPLWLWLIGWAITLGVVVSQDMLQSLLDWVYFIFISLAIWPIFMGFIIGDIVSYVR